MRHPLLGFILSGCLYSTLFTAAAPSLPRASITAAQDPSCFVPPYTLPPLTDLVFHRLTKLSPTCTAIGSNNLLILDPGEFVHEKWLTPSLFRCAAGQNTSEHDIASGWGNTTSARALLERHWDTFINESDFQYLASIGINTIRLPIGYWSLGPNFFADTPFSTVAEVYKNSWPRIVRSINMAGQAGLGVLIDLHGAIGSQNGLAHSGISDGKTQLFDHPSYMKKTIDVLVHITRQLANVNNVVGIQILNEPDNVPSLRNFYDRAISAMRGSTPGAASLPLYLHDSFNLSSFSEYVSNRTDFIVQDHHSYFVFSPLDKLFSASEHTRFVKNGLTASLSAVSDRQFRNLIIGEFSCALPSSSIKMQHDQDKARKSFCSEQLQVYKTASAGWSFWSYAKESCDQAWCFKAAVNSSLPSTFFSYGQRAMDLARLRTLADGLADFALPSIAHILGVLSERQLPPPTHGTHVKRLEIMLSLYRYSRNIHQRHDNVPAAVKSRCKGYTDGFLAATTFAKHNFSKLGFTGQYIRDSVAKLGSGIIKPGTEEVYSDGFMKGLQDAETVVKGVLNQG